MATVFDSAFAERFPARWWTNLFSKTARINRALSVKLFSQFGFSAYFNAWVFAEKACIFCGQQKRWLHGAMTTGKTIATALLCEESAIQRTDSYPSLVVANSNPKYKGSIPVWRIWNGELMRFTNPRISRSWRTMFHQAWCNSCNCKIRCFVISSPFQIRQTETDPYN